MKFTEAQLEAAIIELLGETGYPHVAGGTIERQPQEVLIKSDLREFLAKQYANDDITPVEIEAVIRQLEAYSSIDLYASNKAIMKLVSDGFLLKREDRDRKDLYIQLIDYSDPMAFFISTDCHWWYLNSKARSVKKRLFTMPLFS